MPASRIKGITVEIGGDTTGLNKALQGVNSNIRSTKTQLKDVEKLLKMDPGNTELLRQKYSLLNTEIQDTETKLTALKEAEEQVQQQFERGDVSEEQYNALRREIIATESSLRTLRDQAEQTERAINSVDEQPVEDVADAAEDAQDALGDAGKEASNFGDYLKADAIVEGAKSIVESLKDVAEETKEYQKIMASLEVSSQKAGYTAEETAESYKLLYGYLDDDQSTATTLANLQALGLSQDELTQMIKGTTGAWANYGDSIPIDGLAEAINETVKTSTVTGTFADVLNWAGTSEDEFNEKLAACGSDAERANLIMQELANQGLMDAADQWRENNKAMYDSNVASASLQEQMAMLGEKITPLMTIVTQAVAGVLTWFNSLDGSTQAAILSIIAFVAAIGPVTGAISNIYDSASGLYGFVKDIMLPGLQSGLSSFTSFLISNPVVLILAAIAAIVAAIAVFGDDIQSVLQGVDDFIQNVFSRDWSESFGGLGEVLNGFLRALKNIWDSAYTILNGVIDFIRGVFTGNWTRAFQGLQDIVVGIFSGMATLVAAPLNVIIGLINGVIDGVNWLISGLNKIHFDIPDWVPGIGGKGFGINIGEIGHIPYLAKGGILSQGSAVVGEAGPELLTMTGNQAVVQPLTNQTTNHNIGGVNLYIYGAPGQDVNELADIISERINQEVTRKEAAFG